MSLVVQERQTGNIVVLECAGRIATNEDANQLAEAYWKAMERSEHVLVNMERVSILGSMGLGALILLHQWTTARNRQFRIAGSSSMVREILQLTRLTDVLCVHEDEKQALAAVAGLSA